MRVSVERALSGTERDIVGEVWAAYKAGATVGDAIKAALMDRAVERFGGHLRAAMRAKGFDIGDDEVLTVEVLRRVVSERVGLEIEALTPADVARAVDRLIARRLSERLGVEIPTVVDAEALKASLMESALNAVQTGRANRLMPRASINRIRAVATWARSGVAPSDRKRWLARWYSKKFRRTHWAEWQ